MRGEWKSPRCNLEIPKDMGTPRRVIMKGSGVNAFSSMEDFSLCQFWKIWVLAY